MSTRLCAAPSPLRCAMQSSSHPALKITVSLQASLALPRARPLAQQPGPGQAQQGTRAMGNPMSAEFKIARFWRASFCWFGLG
eukprot:3676710-Alexandrium_andersonii.AAC.1